jgi:hypothetical protein
MLQEIPTESLLAVSKRREYKNNSRLENSWRAIFKKNSSFQTIPNYFVNMNVGVGFLYFSGLKGCNARTSTTSAPQIILKTTKPTGAIVYNRTPLFEGLVGWNITNNMALGLSVMHQSGVSVQFYNMDRLVPSVTPPVSVDIFQADISLDAVVSKLYFTLPYSLIWKTIAYTPYLGLAVGPAWQTWSRVQMSNTYGALIFPFRQKISANCFFGSEAGFKLRSLIPNINLSIIFGCKFNLWGQARSMGKINQQTGKVTGSDSNAGNGYQFALIQPYSIKTVYQWAPFLGFSLAF